MLRLRGLRPRQITTLAGLEAALVGGLGGAAGLGIAALTGRLAFGAASFGASAGTWVIWHGIAFVLGAAVAACAVLVPALRDLRSVTVTDTSKETGVRATRSPWWLRYGLDFALLIGSWLVFRASSGNQYALVLAPEGVPTLSVSYWAFLGPALLWIGAALLLWRLTLLALTHGRPALTRLARPLTATLAYTTAAVLSRRRRPLARSVVLLALAVSFAISTAVFNATYHQQAEADARLTNGADVTVTQPPGAHVPPAAANTLKVSGVRHVEPLQHRFAYVGSDLQDLYGVRPDTIAGATSLQDAYFSGGTAHQLMQRLTQRPDNLLVSVETVHDFQLSPATPSISVSRTPAPRPCAPFPSTTPESSRSSPAPPRTASSSPTPPTWPRRPAATRSAPSCSTPAAPTSSTSPPTCGHSSAPAPPSPTSPRPAAPSAPASPPSTWLT